MRYAVLTVNNEHREYTIDGGPLNATMHVDFAHGATFADHATNYINEQKTTYTKTVKLLDLDSRRAKLSIDDKIYRLRPGDDVVFPLTTTFTDPVLGVAVVTKPMTISLRDIKEW